MSTGLLKKESPSPSQSRVGRSEVHRSTDKADIDLHKTPAETLPETKFSLGRHVRLCNHSLCYCLFRHPVQITIHPAQGVSGEDRVLRAKITRFLCNSLHFRSLFPWRIWPAFREPHNSVSCVFGALCSIMHIPLNLSGLEKSTSPRKKMCQRACAVFRYPARYPKALSRRAP